MVIDINNDIPYFTDEDMKKGDFETLYGENKSQHLYERCHLIAWQLGNENNNKRNLITGTSQLNQAMIEYEKKEFEFLQKYFEKQLADKSKGEVFIVTNKYKNDDLHR